MCLCLCSFCFIRSLFDRLSTKSIICKRIKSRHDRAEGNACIGRSDQRFVHLLRNPHVLWYFCTFSPPYSALIRSTFTCHNALFIPPSGFRKEHLMNRLYFKRFFFSYYELVHQFDRKFYTKLSMYSRGP